jgi:SAM-dependent methyltransferase
MIKKALGNVKRSLIRRIEYVRYPYRRINTMPAVRPSLESVHFFINQLGKHLPVGLTHEVGTGYHELPFPELRFKTSRGDLKNRIQRLSHIQKIKGAYGLDIGCAIGGMTFGLQQIGAHMVGIDRDEPSIAVAKECEALFKTGATFVSESFGEDVLAELVRSYGNPQTGRFDFAIWFSSFNWVAEALGTEATRTLLQNVSQCIDTLIADSAIGGKGASALQSIGVVSNETFVSFVLDNSIYTKFELVGQDADWYGRAVYRFSR